jgi:hypothetical protein
LKGLFEKQAAIKETSEFIPFSKLR